MLGWWEPAGSHQGDAQPAKEREGEREIGDSGVLVSLGTLKSNWLTTLTSTESEGEIHQAGDPGDREQDSMMSKGKGF